MSRRPAQADDVQSVSLTVLHLKGACNKIPGLEREIAALRAELKNLSHGKTTDELEKRVVTLEQTPCKLPPSTDSLEKNIDFLMTELETLLNTSVRQVVFAKNSTDINKRLKVLDIKIQDNDNQMQRSTHELKRAVDLIDAVHKRVTELEEAVASTAGQIEEL